MAKFSVRCFGGQLIKRILKTAIHEKLTKPNHIEWGWIENGKYIEIELKISSLFNSLLAQVHY